MEGAHFTKRVFSGVQKFLSGCGKPLLFLKIKSWVTPHEKIASEKKEVYESSKILQA